MERGFKRVSSLIHGDIFNIAEPMAKSTLKAEMVLSKHAIYFEVENKKFRILVQNFGMFRRCLPFINKLGGSNNTKNNLDICLSDQCGQCSKMQPSVQVKGHLHD